MSFPHGPEIWPWRSKDRRYTEETAVSHGSLGKRDSWRGGRPSGCTQSGPPQTHIPGRFPGLSPASGSYRMPGG